MKLQQYHVEKLLKIWRRGYSRHFVSSMFVLRGWSGKAAYIVNRTFWVVLLGGFSSELSIMQKEMSVLLQDNILFIA